MQDFIKPPAKPAKDRKADKLKELQRLAKLGYLSAIRELKKVAKPKKGSHAGRESATGFHQVRERIRPMVEAHQALNRDAICAELGVSHGVFDSARHYERGRVQGLSEAKVGNVISATIVAQELAPIIEALLEQSRRNQATIAIASLAELAHQLQGLTDRWTSSGTGVPSQPQRRSQSRLDSKEVADGEIPMETQ